MTNEQIAHDLAVARMAGKQLPADIFAILFLSPPYADSLCSRLLC